MHKKFTLEALPTLGATLARADTLITAGQVTDIYLGKRNAATSRDQPESATICAGFYKKSTGCDAAQVKAVRSRLVFTSKGQPPKEFADSAALKKAVAAGPKAIGHIEQAAVDGSIKVALPLN